MLVLPNLTIHVWTKSYVVQLFRSASTAVSSQRRSLICLSAQHSAHKTRPRPRTDRDVWRHRQTHMFGGTQRRTETQERTTQSTWTPTRTQEQDMRNVNQLLGNRHREVRGRNSLERSKHRTARDKLSQQGKLLKLADHLLEQPRLKRRAVSLPEKSQETCEAFGELPTPLLVVSTFVHFHRFPLVLENPIPEQQKTPSS